VRNDPQQDETETPSYVDLASRCPSCNRVVLLRARVVEGDDGPEPDYPYVQQALHIHLRWCVSR
jgi:hypothetical protein